MTCDFQQCGMCDQQRLRPACAYAQSDQSLCWTLEYSTTVKLQTEHKLKFLSLTGGCTGSSASTLVTLPHCWKSRHSSYVTSSANQSLSRLYVVTMGWFVFGNNLTEVSLAVCHLGRSTIVFYNTNFIFNYNSRHLHV